MKRIIITSILLLLLIPKLNAWDFLQACGGRTRSLGNCSVALSDFWSLNNNPAGFANHNNLSLGISYNNRFLLNELSHKNLGALLPLKYGVIGISISQFGYMHYNENIFGLALSRSFGHKFKMGLRLDCIFICFSGNYKNRSTPTFEIGAQYQINKAICLGAYLFNPISARISTINNDHIPIIMRLGLSYTITDSFMITSEIEEYLEHDFSYRLGLEYEVYDDIHIRSGFQLSPETFTFGVGYNHRLFIIDIASEMNQEIGYSLSCSIVFQIKRKINIHEVL